MSARVTNDVPPEVPFEELRRGDFSGLSGPVLIACETGEEFARILRYGWDTWPKGAMILRVSAQDIGDAFRPGKIVLHSARAHQDKETLDFLRWWTEERDGYTFLLEFPEHETRAWKPSFEPWEDPEAIPPLRLRIMPGICFMAAAISAVLGEWFGAVIFGLAGVAYVVAALRRLQ